MCFFFKQKTAYEMRISDWSSDVCSSDLTVGGRYTWEKKRWYGRQQTFIPALAGGFDPGLSIGEALDASVFNFPAGVIQVLDKANEPTYRASLGYQATDDLFVYATYSHGFKAGAFNDQIGSFAPFGNDLDAFADRKSTRLNSSHYCAARMP